MAGRFDYEPSTPVAPYEPSPGYTPKEYRTLRGRPQAPKATTPSSQPSWLDYQLEGYGAAEAGMKDVADSIQVEIDDLQSILGTFTGSGDWITRWMIGNSIKELEERKYTFTQGMQTYYAQGEQAKIIAETAEPGWVPQETLEGWKRDWGRMEGVKETAEMGIEGTKPTGPPVPDWMKPYQESSMQYTKGGAEQLRPIGAQADLSTQQLEKMGGYLGWGQAGAPKYFSKEYVTQLQNLPGWWNELIKQSEELHPVSRKREATRRPASQ